jgi:hypothetical protein
MKFAQVQILTVLKEKDVRVIPKFFYGQLAFLSKNADFRIENPLPAEDIHYIEIHFFFPVVSLHRVIDFQV